MVEHCRHWACSAYQQARNRFFSSKSNWRYKYTLSCKNCVDFKKDLVSMQFCWGKTALFLIFVSFVTDSSHSTLVTLWLPFKGKLNKDIFVEVVDDIKKKSKRQMNRNKLFLLIMIIMMMILIELVLTCRKNKRGEERGKGTA